MARFPIVDTTSTYTMTYIFDQIVSDMLDRCSGRRPVLESSRLCVVAGKRSWSRHGIAIDEPRGESDCCEDEVGEHLEIQRR
jgi:hypothetical protein